MVNKKQRCTYVMPGKHKGPSLYFSKQILLPQRKKSEGSSLMIFYTKFQKISKFSLFFRINRINGRRIKFFKEKLKKMDSKAGILTKNIFAKSLSIAGPVLIVFLKF